MGKEISEFQKQAAITGLKKMFQGRYFDICIVNEVLTISGGVLSRKDEAALRALHCVNFGDMTKELRQMLFLKVMEVISDGTDLDMALIDIAMDARSPLVVLN